jgi:hypothetical protein
MAGYGWWVGERPDGSKRESARGEVGQAELIGRLLEGRWVDASYYDGSM